MTYLQMLLRCDALGRHQANEFKSCYALFLYWVLLQSDSRIGLPLITKLSLFSTTIVDDRLRYCPCLFVTLSTFTGYLSYWKWIDFMF